MAVPITLPESGDAIEVGTVRPLFAVAGIGPSRRRLMAGSSWSIRSWKMIRVRPSR
jgi:hypothetical protein